MRRFPFILLVLMAAGIVLTATAGCGSTSGRLLSELKLSAPSVSASGTGVPISVAYSIARPATVTSYLLSASGDKLYLRKDETRPVSGDYSLTFNGSFAPDPRTEERRVAPSGKYSLVVEARDPSSTEQSSIPVQVLDADTLPPTVTNLSLFPDAISPNGDGVADSLKAGFQSAKRATITIYVVDQSGKRYVLERQDREPAGEHAMTWDGQINNQLLPSGSYRFVVEAQDTAGNVSVAEKPLQIDSASMPDAHILSVNFEPKSLLLGDLVKVTIRVKNAGNTVLKTQGPEPGYVYNSQEGFSTIEGGKFRDQKGLWRVGVDWAGAPGSSGSRYPYRWGLGKDLAPGEEATVVGYIRINEKYPQIWLHAGLVQEQVRYWDNEVGQTVIEIGY